jgi:hypothetical protein
MDGPGASTEWWPERLFFITNMVRAHAGRINLT